MMLRVALAAALAGLASGAGIKEPKGSKVSVLNKDLFQRFMNRNPLVLMEFYAPWCGHCQEMAPKYREAAAQLAAKKSELAVPVKFAKLDDGDEYNREARFGAEDVYNYSSYPALFVFKDGKMDSPYYGGREVEDLVDHMTALANGKDPWEEEKKRRPGLYKTKCGQEVVAELEPETFNSSLVIPATEDNTVWIVEFYSDRCPFCQSLSPEIIKAAETLDEQYKSQGIKKNVRIAALNSRVFDDVPEVWGVTGYPWVTAFYDGTKIADMAGLGGAQSVIDWANRMVAEHWKPENGEPKDKVIELASEEVRAAHAREWKLNYDKEQAKKKAEEAGEEYVEETVEETIEETVEPPKPKAAAGGKKAPVSPSKPAGEKDVAAANAAAEAAAIEAVKSAAAEVDAEGAVEETDDKGAAWRKKLGQYTWFYLHTVAAKYPEYPSDVDMRTIRNMIASLAQHYPCKKCRQHLREKLQDPELGPVRVENRTSLAVWMCDLHNMVNRDTGKPIHDCNPFALDLLYLKDCGECVPEKKGAPTGAAGELHADNFDARLYAKTDDHLMAEMQEAMDAMATRIEALEEENAKLKGM
eukprot:CAMPEP_0119474524 /NCGR_PEP_ID=MMETSP1344-20130328/5743_1 /TAXON_ID=236787 /ORGANISM="Florenciella parvula, Strain CCMP2471" /LENGTH=583 /DNA_ID=CAMNT_0007507845 /DNA_START=43 /DNA_END=1794 /DNA_ORIENTATION=-